MKFTLVTLIACFAFVSCAQPQATGKYKIFPGSGKAGPNEAVATFAEGCFWHAEIIFQSLNGVRDAVSGYAGGTTVKPSYEQVSTGRTGHAETVQIYYDTTKISFETLVNALFASMDPTQANGQGNDMGSEYRSIAFYRTQKEKDIIEAAIKKIDASGTYKSKVVTEVKPFANFYSAEDYHQDYVITSGSGNGYVQNVSIPEYYEFRQHFKGNFKK